MHARKRLREYLDNGGVLIVDDAVGTSEFDAAFRREIKPIYPDQALQAAARRPSDASSSSTTRGRWTWRRWRGSCSRHRYARGCEVIEVDGTLPVIYSPLSLSAGWEQLPRAYNKGYADADALKLGVNVLMYVISH